MGFQRLIFLIRPLDFISMWFGGDQRTYIIKDTCLKDIDYVSKFS